jgi:tetratricopeptide (TPR) repeat protein
VEILTACGGARLLQACVLRARRADAATANAAAIAVLESAVQQAPRAVPPRLLLGTAHLLRFHAARSPGDLQAAEDHLSEAARLAPDQADVHRWLGYLHRAAGRPQAAIAAWQRAVALNPRFTKELDPMIARARP